MVRLTALFAQGGGIAGSAPILMMVAIFGIFYVLLIMPQQRRQKKWQAMLTQIKSGDKVITSGGITGTVMSVKDDALVLRLPPDNIKIEVTRASVVTLTTNEGEKSSS
jgi:preprotein translocase subunit YajC